MNVRLLQTFRSNQPTVQKPSQEESCDPTEFTVVDECNDDAVGESLETVVVELQHDLRAKATQCDMLRDTLAAISKQIGEQQSKFQEEIQEVNDELTNLTRLLAMKESAWEKKEAHYEDLLDQKDEECAEWKAKYDDLVMRLEELESKQATPAPKAEDDLLGSLPNTSGPFGYDSSEEVLRKHEASLEDDDSILEQYGELPDTAERSPGFTNRVRPYRKKKRGHPIKKFKMMPMNWIGTTPKKEAQSVPAIIEEEPVEDEFNEQMEAMSLADMYTDDEGMPMAELVFDTLSIPSEVSNEATKNYDVACRRRRIRKAAKKKSVAGGFDVEKIEC